VSIFWFINYVAHDSSSCRITRRSNLWARTSNGSPC